MRLRKLRWLYWGNAIAIPFLIAFSNGSRLQLVFLGLGILQLFVLFRQIVEAVKVDTLIDAETRLQAQRHQSPEVDRRGPQDDPTRPASPE